ncbi:MAG: DNA mismatch repair endonuclease MutL, partial [Clostridia bacterium]|nr:DNA mismatch repair endonuclease MutL [Clostridia bacterium]
MPKIHVLDKHTAELIAAGEVVERPASVVKELLENTIDAGATSVTVEIKNGGVSLIRITDNGCGMAYEDVPRAFLRHATSKVRTEEDLECIGTLGFRGEALASVAAVADVKLITCTDDNGLGTIYRIAGGEELEYDEIGAAKGTVITVSDLFYNVPARMKFLKKDVSEGNAVAGVVQKIALSHPEVSFRFIRDGKEEMLTPGDGKLYSCIYAVLGREFAVNLIPVEYTLDGVHVYGFCCKPSATRANRTMQHFFINGRYVKTDTAAVAMSRAYQGLIMVGRFPACVLHIDVAPQAVDVNVHPAKIEVRFVNERPVFDAVYHGVRSALQSGDTLQQAVLPQTEKRTNVFAQRPVPQGNSGAQTAFRAVTETKPVPVAETKPFVPAADVEEAPSLRMRDDTAKPFVAVSDIPEPVTVAVETPLPTASVQEEKAPTEEPVVTVEEVKVTPRVVGEIFTTYILAEYGDELLVIDKHAAHERMLYNVLKNTAEPAAQMLLEPQTVTLDSDACNALLAALPQLTKAGYIVEDFGGLTVLVRAVPVMLSGCDVASVIEEIAGGLASGKRDILTGKEDWIYHSIA